MSKLVYDRETEREQPIDIPAFQTKYLIKLARLILDHEDILRFKEDYRKTDLYWLEKIGWTGFAKSNDDDDNLETIRSFALRGVVRKHFEIPRQNAFDKTFDKWHNLWRTTELFDQKNVDDKEKNMINDAMKDSFIQVKPDLGRVDNTINIIEQIEKEKWIYDPGQNKVNRDDEREPNRMLRNLGNFEKCLFYTFLQSSFKDNFFKQLNRIDGLIDQDLKDYYIFAVFLWCHLSMTSVENSQTYLLRLMPSDYKIFGTGFDLRWDEDQQNDAWHLQERLGFLRRHTNYIHYEVYSSGQYKPDTSKTLLLRLHFGLPGTYLIQNCDRTDCVRSFNIRSGGDLDKKGPQKEDLIPVTKTPGRLGCYFCGKEAHFKEIGPVSRTFCTNGSTGCQKKYYLKYQ